MKAFIFTVIVLCLFGCSVLNKSSSDEYIRWRTVKVPDLDGMEITPTLNINERTIRLHFKSEEEMKNTPPFIWKIYWSEAVDSGFSGYTYFSKDESVPCEVHVLRPKDADDYAFFYALGHEVYHCFYGHYHKG